MGYTKPNSKLITWILFITLIITPVAALDNWVYYRQITIKNSVAQNLTDYQIAFTLDTADLIAQGKMRSDCGDLRVTLGDGKTLLPYWIEPNTCNTGSTKIWAKVPSIPANSTITILLWYGNPQAASAANASAVFVHYNDWESGTLEGWNILNGGGSGTANVVQIDGRYQLKLTAPNINNRVLVNRAVNTSNAGYMLETLLRTDSAVSDAVGMGFGSGDMISASADSPANAYIYFVGRGLNAYDYIYKSVAGSWTQLTSRNNNLATNTYYKLGFIWYGNNLTAYFNGIKVLSATDSTFNNFTHIFLSASSGNYYFDWVIVRKCVLPEPSINIGVEQKIIGFSVILPHLAAFMFIFLLLVAAVIIRKNIFILISMLVILIFIARLQITQFADYMLAVFALIVLAILGAVFYGRWRE